MFDGTLVKLIKFPAEHLTIFHGTLVFRGTPVENHWLRPPTKLQSPQIQIWNTLNQWFYHFQNVKLPCTNVNPPLLKTSCWRRFWFCHISVVKCEVLFIPLKAAKPLWDLITEMPPLTLLAGPALGSSGEEFSNWMSLRIHSPAIAGLRGQISLYLMILLHIVSVIVVMPKYFSDAASQKHGLNGQQHVVELLTRHNLRKMRPH